jgi:hypothetical protein
MGEEGRPIFEVTFEGDYVAPRVRTFSGYERPGFSTALTDCSWEHHVCGGAMDLQPTTAKVQTLHCRKCGLRVSFPVNIATYGEMRRHFLEKLGGIVEDEKTQGSYLDRVNDAMDD